MPPQLEQAFLNLILNAAEAMPEGGTLTIKSPHNSVPRDSDTPDARRRRIQGHRQRHDRRTTPPRVYLRLSTTKAKGTGLGLAIVGRVMETHRGELKIRSRFGPRNDHQCDIAFVTSSAEMSRIKKSS